MTFKRFSGKCVDTIVAGMWFYCWTRDPSHTAHASQALARRLGLRLLWLPKRAPELNPMDTLWGQAKDATAANKQYVNIDEQAEVFIAHLRSLSNKDALRTSGVLSNHFWLKHVLSK
jgi:hypothetical protein